MNGHVLTVGSLFAGIGGIDLGLEMTGGFRTAWQVEIDAFCRKVLAKHWPDVPRHDDVRTFPPDESEGWRVDLIAGGFPCQDVSYAGKGAGLAGDRSGLWHEAARVVRVLRPRYVFLENVSALLTRGLDSVLGTLASLGYVGEAHCLPAAYVGAPHIRDRVFILGHAARFGARRVASTGRPWDAVGESGRHPGPVADADGRGGDPGAEHPGRETRPDAGERRGRGVLDLRPSGDRRSALADAVGEQSERWRVGGVLDGAAGSREADREERQRDGDAAEHRREALADADGSRQRQSRGHVGQVWGRPGDGSPEDRLAEFRSRAGAHWIVDPADDPESQVGRMAHGVPRRVDRLRGLGNAVVPQVARFWGERILEHHRANGGGS